MSSLRSMKFQILAAAALLLSGSYIAAAADPPDQAQWSESIPLGDSPWAGPGERIEAYIVDGLLHARRLDQNDSPRWHLILAEADPNQPPTLEQLGGSTAIEVRHANGMYFVRDTFQSFPSTLAAHRQQLAPEAFASLDTTLRQNGIDGDGNSYIVNVTPDKLQEIPPEAFASVDSTTLAGLVQQLGPEAFASLDSSIGQSSPPRVLQRGIFKWEKDGQLWVALGPNINHWDTLIRLAPTVFVPRMPNKGAFADGAFLTWDDAHVWDSSGMLIASYASPFTLQLKRQYHKLVRGAIPFNIEAQRWINPIEHGDRIGWFLGKVVVLHFWATWSPESVEQLAHYDELYKKHKDEGLVVIAIHSAEGADDLDAFIAERGYTVPIAVDAGASAQRYGVWTFPQSVLLDRKCRLAWISEDGKTPSQAPLNYLLDDAFPTH